MASRDDALGEPFAIDVDEGEARSRIRLSGAFGAGCAERFKQELARVQAAAPRQIELDLRRLTFIDSTGVGLLLDAHKDCEKQGTRLAVLRGGGPVERVFSLTGLDEVLPLLDASTPLDSGEQETSSA